MITQPVRSGPSIRRRAGVSGGLLVLICGAGMRPQLMTAQDIAAAMDAHLSDRTANGYFSGAVLVSEHRRVLLRKGYGAADLERRVANTPETIFRIGSITKPVTAPRLNSPRRKPNSGSRWTTCRGLWSTQTKT